MICSSFFQQHLHCIFHARFSGSPFKPSPSMPFIFDYLFFLPLKAVVNFAIIVTKMITKEKKIWCEEEDFALKQLFEEEGEQSWSVVAKRLSAQYNFSRKSAKQCRQRYENHICAEGLRVEWSPEEQRRLVELHNEVGNKWSLIAAQIPGKSDNCIKNHFYSKLRKILRKLNTVIHSHLRREYRQINIGTLYKIVEATEERFKEDPACGYSVSITCQEVQNRMLTVSMLKEQEFDSEQRLKIYTDIVRDVVTASKLYKRKSKKTRNSAIQAPNARRKKIREAHIIVKNQEDEEGGEDGGYESDPSSAFEEEVKEEEQKAVVVQVQQENIRDILKDAGILKEEQSEVDRSVIKFSSKSSFRSYSQNNNVESDNQFFDDSQNEKGFNSKRKGSFFRYKSALFDNPSEFSEREGGPDFNIN